MPTEVPVPLFEFAMEETIPVPETLHQLLMPCEESTHPWLTLIATEISEPPPTDSMENREVLIDSDLTETDQIDLSPLSDEEYISDDEFELADT